MAEVGEAWAAAAVCIDGFEWARSRAEAAPAPPLLLFVAWVRITAL